MFGNAYESRIGGFGCEKFYSGLNRTPAGLFAGDLRAAMPAALPMRNGYVTLEPLAPGHLAAIWGLAAAAPESRRWLPMARFADYKTFNAYARLIMSSQEEMLWCVRPHDAQGKMGPPAGWLGLLDIQPARAAAELGNIWFPPGLARSRAATAALALLLEQLFDRCGFWQLTWRCDPRNAASAACALRLGFNESGADDAGDLRRFSLHGGDWPMRRMALNAWLSPENFDADGRQLRPLKYAA